MKIVTGGAGQLGIVIVYFLISKGSNFSEITAMVRTNEKRKNLKQRV